MTTGEITASLKGVVEAPHTTPTQAAAKAADKAAEKEAKAQERKAAAEREKHLETEFDKATMGVGAAMREVSLAKDVVLCEEDGTTVGSYMAELNLPKLSIKALRACLPSDFIDGDGQICMPTWTPAVVDASPEHPHNGKSVFYFVEKKTKAGKSKTWKVAQVPSFAPIVLWTPQVIRRLLKAALKYDAAKRTKKAAEVAKVKHFYVVEDTVTKNVNGSKDKSSTCKKTFVEVAKEFVKF